ncbi:OASTL2 [Auxenochlorella protothecoides x Auxenochlorella symbiontica]
MGWTGALSLVAAAFLGSTTTLVAVVLVWRKRPGVSQQGPPPIRHGLLGLIGNTPLVRIESLSRETGCEILAKAEFLNPGGSVKDRVAAQILEEALASGALRPGGTVTEGTAGSTGVSLALCARAAGCGAFVAMPDDAAREKADTLRTLGAEVRRMRPVSIAHPDHFVNVARRAAAEREGAVFANQFENLANFRAHLRTGREILAQTDGMLDAFVSGAGTGGTLAGVSCALKAANSRVKVFLIDPPGSGLFNKVTRGVMFTREEAEGRRLRHSADTITEGIGINRQTANFGRALVDGAFQGSDTEAVEMAAYLLRNDGLFVGSSAAMNCVGAVKAARLLGPGATIVTVLCDGGARHLSRFHNAGFLAEQGLAPVATGTGLAFVSNGPYRPAIGQVLPTHT